VTALVVAVTVSRMSDGARAGGLVLVAFASAAACGDGGDGGNRSRPAAQWGTGQNVWRRGLAGRVGWVHDASFGHGEGRLAVAAVSVTGVCGGGGGSGGGPAVRLGTGNGPCGRGGCGGCGGNGVRCLRQRQQRDGAEGHEAGRPAVGAGNPRGGVLGVRSGSGKRYTQK